jgi:hypothetical protein
MKLRGVAIVFTACILAAAAPAEARRASRRGAEPPPPPAAVYAPPATLLPFAPMRPPQVWGADGYRYDAPPAGAPFGVAPSGGY